MLDLEELVKAYKDCRSNKRNTINALAFEFDLEDKILRLYNELKSGTYKIGSSVCFIVLFPKVREVWAADFNDRVVHHLVYNRIKDRFYNRFIPTTYSCIPKRGTLKAGLCVEKMARSVTRNYTRPAYYLKADLQNFFVSIDKAVLMKELERYVHEEWILKLLRQIVWNDPRESVYIKSPSWKFKKLASHKSLWNSDNSKGLPIGNLTSQFFSNVYLNILDQYVKHHLKCKYYCRYVDDFIIMSDDPHQLNEWHKDLAKFLQERLALTLHPNKKSINKIERGIDFVGFVVKPYRMVLRQKTLKRLFKRIREFKESPVWFYPKEMLAFRNSVNSYLGMLRGISGYNMRRKICLECINLFIGCDEEFTKLIYRG
ncbi:MAG: RNA-directed DNA polymerase [Heliobacteriaceae bacterium]|jgi:hypothetical protein|nr:RNA-directed DNA polymerase [Heliobacteriaceae bacterium]